MSTPLAPWPIEDAETAPFWAAVRQHRLLLQRCARCRRHQLYPRALCTSCTATELDWVDAAGTGVVYSFTVSHRAVHPVFADRVPFIVALVDLDEGPRMLSNLIGPPGQAVIGQRVGVEFVTVASGVVLPMFRALEARNDGFASSHPNDGRRKP